MSAIPGSRPRPVEPFSGLVLGRTLSEHQGQSRRVCLIDSHPGWLYKEYLKPLTAGEEAHVSRLIAFPALLTPSERSTLESGTSWPVSRVPDGGATRGVIIPVAPERYWADFRILGGKVERRPRTIDWLATPQAKQEAAGVVPPSPAGRASACASIATVAALFEKHGIVYLDWSFRNAFWDDRSQTTYVIDVDGCTFAPRGVIGSPGWDDPLCPAGTPGGNPVDRYRVALLVARCLTVQRATAAMATLVGELDRLVGSVPTMGPVREHIASALGAGRLDDRPPLATLEKVLRSSTTVRPVGPDGVVGWRALPAAGRRAGTAPSGTTTGGTVRRGSSIAGAAAATTSGTPRTGAVTPPPTPRPFTTAPDRQRSTPRGDDGSSAAAAIVVVIGVVVVIFVLVVLVF